MPAFDALPHDPFHAAAQHIYRLFHYLDEGQIEQAAGLFASDGVWIRQGQKLVGPDGVLQALRSRPKALATRHLVSNLLIDGIDGGVSAHYYLTVFAHEGAVDGVPPLTAPQSILVCEDRLAWTATGWRFSLRTPRLVFKKT